MSDIKASLFIIFIIMYITLQGKTYVDCIIYFTSSSFVAILLLTVCEFIDNLKGINKWINAILGVAIIVK